VQDRIRGAPDLMIEVLSPNPRIGTTEEHLRGFAHYGVRECWLVHQDQHRISVVTFEDFRASTRRLTGRTEPIVSSVLPDFSMSLQHILEL
jgi:Uma2 family endonuclease